MAKRFDKLVVLDLDETLIHAAEKPLNRAADFEVGEYHVYRRPYVEQFLKTCASWFETAVWTSASPAYAAAVVRAIWPRPEAPVFVFCDERCTQRYDAERQRYISIKNLQKIKRRGYDLRKVLVVDDTPETFSRNYGNGIHVAEYRGDENDEELLYLLTFLEQVGPLDHLRQVEKRGWRSRVEKVLPWTR